MVPTILPITPGFAAEVGDIDLSSTLSPETERIVRDAFAQYGVLVFTGQTLTPEQHLAFARLFGPHERSVATVMPGQKLRIRQELADIANMTADGEVWDAKHRMRLFQMGNRLWHTDSSFKQPTGYTSMLYCKSVVPIGGHTEFADLRAAWDTLSEEMKQKVEGLIAEHSLLFSRRRLGFSDFSEQEKTAWTPLPRPVVRTIPESGRRALYLASHIGRIRGMADEEAEALLQQLIAHATDRRITYLHRWRVGDLVLWDNRCTMHRGTEFDDTRYPRDMQRATTEDKPDAFATELRAAGLAA
jgi:alpha-ketoglutarate-dependent 2,4-dichlorophenoxyacetate dioxygenase